jgi:alkyl sulfatase BDS1-like metallo-beta-lactamase superfamily hydrolase
MPTLEQLSDDLWRGVHSTSEHDHHPFRVLDQIEEVADGVAFYKAFSNITTVNTDDGCVLIDTGSFNPNAHSKSFAKVRSWTKSPIDTAIYTHGHVDHAYGLPPFLAEAKEQGWNTPDIVGHERVVARMDRYIETAGYNEVINERQFGFPVEWPTSPIYPTQTYEESMDLFVNGIEFNLHHAQGETDDHTWVFLPKQRVLCTGDLFIWAAPNAGNPQKVQRYISEWARALRRMAEYKPEVLLPGHGVPVFGADRVQAVLIDTATYLESIYDQTLNAMNAGASVDELIHAVKPPTDLAEKPYLQPVYDEPEFIVRNIHRCLGGWYCGTPSELKPAPRSEQANEIATLAGGINKLIERAEVMLNDQNFRMASHLADWAVEAEPKNRDAHAVRARVYAARTTQESSTMAKGIYGATARDAQRNAENLGRR